MPVEIFVGDDDKLTPPGHSRQLADALPEAQLHQVERTGTCFRRSARSWSSTRWAGCSRHRATTGPQREGTIDGVTGSPRRAAPAAAVGRRPAGAAGPDRLGAPADDTGAGADHRRGRPAVPASAAACCSTTSRRTGSTTRRSPAPRAAIRGSRRSTRSPRAALDALGLPDDGRRRQLVLAWFALTEDLVGQWAREPTMSRDELLALLRDVLDRLAAR